MQTDELIHKLSQDLKNPSDTRHWKVKYWALWLICCVFLIALTYGASLMAPNEIHFPENLNNIFFWTEIFMWFGIAVLAALMAYWSSLTKKINSWIFFAAYSALTILIISLFSRLHFFNLAAEFTFELQLWRGPCGFFIALTGIGSTLVMFFVTRRATPIHPTRTATWSALSVGAVSALLMHMVCTHGSAMHVLLWHVLPLALLILIARLFSKKLLRW